MGRHSHPDDDTPDLDPTAALAAGPESASGPKTSAVADLQLALHNPRLLVTCLAVVIAPFACYFAVIAGLGKLQIWAIFIGAPLVLAGILVGAVLDRAYSALAAGARGEAPPITAPASAAPAKLG